MLDGDGYLSAFSFAGGNRVHFRSRYVRTRSAPFRTLHSRALWRNALESAAVMVWWAPEGGLLITPSAAPVCHKTRLCRCCGPNRQRIWHPLNRLSFWA
jgi:carotenoid cleavage dioxygenase-like enzyme